MTPPQTPILPTRRYVQTSAECIQRVTRGDNIVLSRLADEIRDNSVPNARDAEERTGVCTTPSAIRGDERRVIVVNKCRGNKIKTISKPAAIWLYDLIIIIITTRMFVRVYEHELQDRYSRYFWTRFIKKKKSGKKKVRDLVSSIIRCLRDGVGHGIKRSDRAKTSYYIYII